jgi:hypothetical protein
VFIGIIVILCVKLTKDCAISFSCTMALLAAALLIALQFCAVGGASGVRPLAASRLKDSSA